MAGAFRNSIYYNDMAIGMDGALEISVNQTEALMRFPLRYAVLALAVAAAACQDQIGVPTGDVAAPTNLTYQIEPSGVPYEPLGLLLAWTAVSDPDLGFYRVYSRGSGGQFVRRGETTSNTFHDSGIPHLEYFVVSVSLGGGESQSSNVVFVDERLLLEDPATLTGISLNRAIHLTWSDNAFTSAPSRFAEYRVYTTSYNLDTGFCGTQWLLDGTTVAPEFLSAALVNGQPRCFGITAVSTEGWESLWSPLWQDTPRPDGRNVLVFAYEENQPLSGFRFWDDVNGDNQAQASELGLIQDGNRTDIDFWVHREADSSLWIVPEFTGTNMRLYSNQPIADLTSIDYAPAAGYTHNMFEAVPTYGYVFEIVDAGSLHYAALRVTHVGRDYLIFDWSVQSDNGNGELLRHGGQPTVVKSGFEVRQP